MALRVLIVPDKFKGTLTAPAAAQSIAQGWRHVRPQDQLDLLPMSDGGDGFGEVLSALLGAAERTVRTVDAAHRPLQARWWWDAAQRTAIIESAQIVGLALLPPRKFHPFVLDTFGLGAALAAAARCGARRCLIGIGGSATNDAGFGLARSLGWRFLDRRGKPLERWTDLPALAHLGAPKHRRPFRDLVVAVDVRNRLLGLRGATRVYGPQKGLTAADFPVAERCLRRLVRIARQDLGLDLAREPGTGAAGGLGYGLRCFLGARLEPGFALFARSARLTQRLRAAQLVLTGEGAIDVSTLMGKGVGEVARLCRRYRVPCVGMAGMTDQSPRLARRFTQVHCLAPELTTPTEAHRDPAHWLAELAARLAERWGLFQVPAA